MNQVFTDHLTEDLLLKKNKSKPSVLGPHSRGNLRTQGMFQAEVLGSDFVGKWWVTEIKQACPETGCKRPASPDLG